MTASRAEVKYSKLFFATIDTETAHGCFYEPLKGTTTPDLLVNIELGEFTVSDPSAVKGMRINSDGYVNDSWAIAIGVTEPESVIYELPNAMKYDFYSTDTIVDTKITNRTFKVFLLVNLKYRNMTTSSWLALSKGAPSAKASSIKKAMSSQCSANNASSQTFTDGFYGNNISVKLLFE